MKFVAGRRLGRGITVGVGVGLVGAAASLLPWMLELEEDAGLGWLFARRGPIPPPDDVAIIAISRDSADALGASPELDEWPRALHAELIETLDHQGAEVIVFDLFFDEPRDSADDERLGAAIEAAGNVVLLERVRSDNVMLPGGRAVIESRHPPIDSLKEGALASAPFTLPVVPIRTNQFWTFGRAAGDTPTLPVMALQAYLLDEYEQLTRLVRVLRPALGEQLPAGEAVRDARRFEDVVRRLRGAFSSSPSLRGEVETALAHFDDPHLVSRLEALLDVYAGSDHRYLDYYGPAGTIRTVAYHRALRPAEDSREDFDLAGKVVFVGYSESRQPEQQDAFISVFSERSGQNLSGVEIGATAFANLLERRQISPLSIPASLALFLSFGLLAGVSFSVLPAFAAVAAALLGAGAYGGLALWQFTSAGVWLPLIVPVLLQLPLALFAALLWTYQHLRVQRERIEAAFGYYLPAREVRRFAEQHVDAGASGELQYGTCLLTDVERYTALSERLHPTDLHELLNRYYAVMLEVVERHGGVVTDFAGDSMVALWSGETPSTENTVRACRAALEIAHAVQQFNGTRGGLELPTAVGLDTGLVLLGNVGAGRRFEYRAVGDIVTTASRLQGLNRMLGTRVLVSGATAGALDDEVGVRDLGKFLLRGKSEPVSVYELSEGTDRSESSALEHFEEALGAFNRGDWPRAATLFQRAAQICAGDGPSRFYATLSEQFAARPPADWKGAVRVDAK